MIWFVQDFALLSVILRAITLSLQSLLLGGIIFIFLVRPTSGPAFTICRRWIARFALIFFLPQILFIAIDSAVLLGTSDMQISNLLTADYFLAGSAAALASLAIYFLANRKSATTLGSLLPLLPFTLVLIATAVWTSHAVSRIDNRLLLAVFTALHQISAASWIGGMAFLLFSLSITTDLAESRRFVGRFSWVASISAVVLIGSGICLSLYYLGSWPALYGTAYGFMLVVKVVLLCSLLMLGALNWSLGHKRESTMTAPPTTTGLSFGQSMLLLLRRFAEAEIAIGFTIILAASSLTSQPPAVDLTEGRLTAHEIIQRFTPQMPRFTSPPVGDLAPPTPLDIAVKDYDNTDRAAAHQQDPDIAWSEYSHHWAGIIILVIGIGAFLSKFKGCQWARHWPLGFIALAVFSFLRGDPENWPLGPISFWKSFYDPEVLMHRLYDVVFIVYAAFQWGVETGRLTSRKAAYVFPIMLTLGGAGLLLHNHALGNVNDELLIEMSHNTMGILAILSGLGLWLQIRLPEGQAQRIAAHLWPVFFTLIGLVLLNYREA